MEKYLIYDFSQNLYGREPVIRRLNNGILVCSFLTGGTAEPQNKNVVCLSRSFDDGRTWSEPETAVRHSERGCWATEIFTETDRPFIVVHTYNTNDYRVEHYRELQTFQQYLTPDGKMSGEPVSFKGGLNGVSLRQGIVMSNGEWLFPLYWQEVEYDFDWSQNTSGQHENRERYPFRCGVAISGNGGETFERYGYLVGPKSLWEPNCIELEQGHIMLLMRSNNEEYLRRSDSYDYGRTWTCPIVTDIENAHTKLTLFKIENTVFLVNNFVKAQGLKNRTHLQIRASEDGEHWRIVCKPEEDEANFFYPHVSVSTETATVYLAYENGIRHYLNKIKFEELF